MKCDKQCSYRTPYGYCSVTQCQRNLGTTYAELGHLKKEKKMDIKKYCIPKEEYDIPTVNEGIQEGRILVFCKDCKYSSSNGLYGCYLEHFELEKDHIGRLLPTNGVRMYSDDFCSRGERKDD